MILSPNYPTLMVNGPAIKILIKEDLLFVIHQERGALSTTTLHLAVPSIQDDKSLKISSHLMTKK